jgi:O-antigen/teichoic acid export membrane protein
MYSDFARKVSETFFTRLLLLCIRLVTTVIVARTLGPEGRGLYAVALAFSAMGVQFGNLGLHASNTYYVARNKRLLPRLVGNTLVVSFIMGGGGALTAWGVFYLWPDLSPVTGTLLVLSLVWIPFGLAYMLLQNLLLGIHEVRAYNKIELITKILALALLGLIVFFGAATVELVFSAGLIGLIAGALWILLGLKSSLSEAPRPSLALFKDNIAYGLKAYAGAFFAFLVLRAGLLMIKYLLDPEQAGYYSISSTMAEMMYMIPVVIGTILFPKLSAMNSTSEKWGATRKVVLLVVLIMLALAGLSYLLAEPVVTILFGEAFLPAVPAFLWLMPGVIMLSVNTVYMNYFASTGMPLITVYSPAIAAAVNIVLNMKLIPVMGIIGASVSISVSYGLMLLASIIYIKGQQRK